MSNLRIKTGPNKGKIYQIGGEVITIGRDDNQTIQVLDQGVSRQHAEIFNIGEMVFVRDLNSTNGTFVNNQRITEEALKAGDELLIGTTVMLMEEPVAKQPTTVSLDKDEKGGKEKKEKKVNGLSTTTVELAVGAESSPQERGGKVKHVESRHLSLIYEIGKKLQADRDHQEIMQDVLQLVAGAIKADAAYFLVHERKSGRMVQTAAVEKEGQGERQVSRAIIRRVMANQRPLLTEDATLDQRFTRSESIVLKKIKSVICVPFVAAGRMSGMLYFHRSGFGEAFVVEDLELATSASLQFSMLVSSSESSAKIRRAMMSTIQALVATMEVADPKDQGHAQRVADYGVAIARQMRLSSEDVHRVRLAALLHDIGKVAVRHSIPGVTPEQLREQHVFQGEKILRQVEGFEDILPGVRFHHERADGSGFPGRVKNEKIPVTARIIIAANAFDNECRQGGPDRSGLPTKDVLKKMAEQAGKQFDNDVVQALLVCHRSGKLFSRPTEKP